MSVRLCSKHMKVGPLSRERIAQLIAVDKGTLTLTEIF